MKWIPHGFRNDVVEFTWLDLINLMLGRQLKDGALIAVRKGVKHE